jgi:hypothetical protein
MTVIDTDDSRVFDVIAVMKRVGYLLLAVFMLFLAIMTYRHGGGFSDWKAIAVIVTMLALFGLIGWMGFGSTIARLRRENL